VEEGAQRAFATADAEELEAAAHRLTGGAATLGADALAAAFRPLEDRALDGYIADADDVRRTAEQLEEDVLVHDEPSRPAEAPLTDA
jgi:HPt (histidine-containing phosphotransfer) domain-containing protein